MSEMAGLQTALSGLAAQRTALSTIGQNIANASTQGYHRQRVDMANVGAPALAALWSRWEGPGQGVAVTGISRSYDQFLTAQSRSAHASSSFLAGQQQVLATVEQVIGEPSDTGIASQLSAFWGAWQDVANNPTSSSVRTALLQQAQTLAGGFHQVANAVAQLWQTSRAQADTVAATATAQAQQVAQLNAAIRTAVAGGSSANDLMDQRDNLVDQLASEVGATATVESDGTATVYLGGSALVRGSVSRGLAISGTSSFTGVPSPAGAPVANLTWADDGSTVGYSGGQVGAMLDAVNTALPGWRDRIDSVAAAVASQVNAQQALGFDANGAAGQAMFTGTTASTLTVALSDPKLVAASATAPAPGPPPVPSADGTNALDMGQIGGAAGSPDSLYRSVVADLGVAAATANTRSAVQDQVTSQADSAVQASSGVSIDEEAASLVEYQRAYEASARYMSTVDSTLDTLINHIR